MRPRRRLALALTLAASLGAPHAATAATCPDAGLVPDAGNLERVRDAMLCLVNRERADRGVPALQADDDLRRSASRHARHMAERDFFSHVAPDGATMADRIRATGYLAGARRPVLGENLAWGSGARATAREIVDAWMRSRGHRANLLDRRFRELGVGVAAGAPVAVRASVGGRAATYTTHFGARR